MTRDLILFGSGGLAKEVIGYLDGDRRYNILGCVSSEDFNNRAYAVRFPVWREWPRQFLQLPHIRALLAVGDPDLRRALVEAPGSAWLEWETYVHPSAHVSPYARVSAGAVLLPQAIVCGDAVLGRHVFMNTNATIAHDSVVGDFVSLMPNCEVCGNCSIGDGVLIGIGAQVLPGSVIGAGARVSAGAIVRGTVRAGATVYGDPARERM